MNRGTTALLDFQGGRCAGQEIGAEPRVDALGYAAVAVAEVLSDLRHRGAAFRHPDRRSMAQGFRRDIIEPSPRGGAGESLLHRNDLATGVFDDKPRLRGAVGLDQRRSRLIPRSNDRDP